MFSSGSPKLPASCSPLIFSSKVDEVPEISFGKPVNAMIISWQ